MRKRISESIQAKTFLSMLALLVVCCIIIYGMVMIFLPRNYHTLTLKQIREAMALPPQACCDKLEEEILAAGKPGQDNYTAIALKYHGKNEEES